MTQETIVSDPLAALPEYEVQTWRDGLTITGAVKFTQAPPVGTEIAFYLICDGKVVERRPYSLTPTVVFLANSPGEFSVKAFVRHGNVKVARQSAKQYHDLKAVDSRPLPDLPFVPLALPHQDLAVLRGGDAPRFAATLSSLERRTGLKLTQLKQFDGQAYVIHGQNAALESSEAYFSGMTTVGEEFIFGAPDASTVKPDKLRDQVGDFVLIESSSESIYIRSDYFGVGKIYYYIGEGITCAANRMQLLLEILAACGLALTPNRSKIRASLQATSQAFTQNFSTLMDIEGCHCLPPGAALRIQPSTTELVPTELAHVLAESTHQRVSRADRDALIEDGCTEIVRNLRGALKHPSFDRVRIDVTGGLDSRMLFAALSHLTEFADRTELHTADFNTSPYDLPISLQLSRHTPFRYDTGRRETYDLDADQSLLENISLNLGAYFGIRAEITRTRLPGTLGVNGFYGEVSARPYFARLIYGTDSESLAPEDFPEARIRSMDVKHRPTTTSADLVSHFRSQFERLPGDSAAARFDAFYLYHRNGLHCSDRWMSHVRAPSWGPLQSKSLFALKWRTLDTYRDITVQVLATEHLNAELAKIPIGREKDNLDRSRISSKYPSGVQEVATLLEPSGADLARFKSGGTERRKNSQRFTSIDSPALQAKNANMLRNHLQWVLAGIAELRDTHRIISPREAEELGSYIEREYGKATKHLGPAGTVLTSKVLSAVYQCRIVEGTDYRP